MEVAGRKLEITRPEDGAKFALVDGMPQQRIACQVAENPDGARLWWFLDGVPVGESLGTRPFAVGMERGEHVISCSDADGSAASVRVTVAP